MPRSPQGKNKTSTSSRLEAADWISAAIDAMESKGIDGVRVETLAKTLRVTKGSFYWHFRDRRALMDAMLDEWRRRATIGIIDRLESAHEPAKSRLQKLLRLQFDASSAASMAHIELSIRLWGRTDRKAMQVLREIDSLRLRYIAGLFGELGYSPEEADARAVLAYSYMRVSRALIRVDDFATMKQCEGALFSGANSRKT